jgi:hypothetical protein
MKLIFRLLLLYLLFLIQTAIAKPQLDLVVLGLVIFSLHDTPVFSIILGAWGGILLGLVSPVHFGFHIIALTTIAFACNNIRRFIYKYKTYFISILIIALLFKYVLSLIFLGAQQSFLSWLFATLIILIIAIPLENLIIKVFYPAPIFRR